MVTAPTTRIAEPPIAAPTIVPVPGIFEEDFGTAVTVWFAVAVTVVMANSSAVPMNAC